MGNKSEREKYCMLMHIYMEYIKTADKPIFSAAMEMQTHSWERRGWDKQKVALKRTLQRAEQVANGNLLHNTESSTWDSVITQRCGLAGEGGDIFILMIHTVGWQKQCNVVKQLSSN